MRGVNPLITERHGRLSQSVPSFPQIFREFLRQGFLSGCPTVVLISILDPLLAVVALPTGHTPQFYWVLADATGLASQEWASNLALIRKSVSSVLSFGARFSKNSLLQALHRAETGSPSTMLSNWRNLALSAIAHPATDS